MAAGGEGILQDPSRGLLTQEVIRELARQTVAKGSQLSPRRGGEAVEPSSAATTPRVADAGMHRVDQKAPSRRVASAKAVERLHGHAALQQRKLEERRQQEAEDVKALAVSPKAVARSEDLVGNRTNDLVERLHRDARKRDAKLAILRQDAAKKEEEFLQKSKINATKDSKSKSPSDQEIFSRLHATHTKNQNRKLKLRTDARKQEMAQIKRPTSLERSRRLAKGQARISDRVAAIQMERKEWLERSLQEKEDREMKEVRLRPEISDRAKRLERRPEDCMAWDEQRRQRLWAEQTKRRELDILECTFRPQVNPPSERRFAPWRGWSSAHSTPRAGKGSDSESSSAMRSPKVVAATECGTTWMNASEGGRPRDPGRMSFDGFLHANSVGSVGEHRSTTGAPSSSRARPSSAGSPSSSQRRSRSQEAQPTSTSSRSSLAKAGGHGGGLSSDRSGQEPSCPLHAALPRLAILETVVVGSPHPSSCSSARVAASGRPGPERPLSARSERPLSARSAPSKTSTWPAQLNVVPSNSSYADVLMMIRQRAR